MSLQGKTVLVTGAGGSIGSELCRQIMYQDPKMLLMLDNSELNLFNIERELHDKRAVSILEDIVRDERSRAWDSLPDIVYHTAAYKHVTLCEQNPEAAWTVNVLGTQNLLNAARAYKTPKFIFISTDKAVRPTSVMGKTKRSAEEMVRGAGYTVIRFGNVRGSSGSVLSVWKEQIEKREPVTITDPCATRYFISPGEAVKRIIEVTDMPVGTYVPYMGTPANLLTLARHQGAREIEYIGLRPGEKLHEELYEHGPVKTESPNIFRDSASSYAAA